LLQFFASAAALASFDLMAVFAAFAMVYLFLPLANYLIG